MYSDSDCEGDTQTRKSISGWESFLEGCIISWGSRGQNTIAQSSTEAEIVAQNEAVRNLLFIKYIIEFLDISIESPITLFCDNNGENFLANNFESKRTKHLDIKDLFLRDLIVDKIVRTKFIKSEENKADPFTKNVSEKLFLRFYDYLNYINEKDDNEKDSNEVINGYNIKFFLMNKIQLLKFLITVHLQWNC